MVVFLSNGTGGEGGLREPGQKGSAPDPPFATPLLTSFRAGFPCKKLGLRRGSFQFGFVFSSTRRKRSPEYANKDFTLFRMELMQHSELNLSFRGW